MASRLFSVVSILAVSGALVAGCGSSSSSSSAASSTTTSSAPAATTTSSAGSSSSSTSASTSASPVVQQAVATCKTEINAQPTLSSSLKTKLLGICDQIASGNVASAKKIAAQVCQEVVKAAVPQAAQTQALAACPKA
jgi:hypothetical protein